MLPLAQVAPMFDLGPALAGATDQFGAIINQAAPFLFKIFVSIIGVYAIVKLSKVLTQ